MRDDNPDLKTKKKPKWLRTLERQSWQAELLISGIAIFGSLQLPAVVEGWQEYLLIHSNASTGFFYMILFNYLYVGIYGVIVNFILHFMIRALWIGIIGMNSVFPEGIKTDTSVFGEGFMQKVKDKFPNVNEFNEQLDRLGSIMFSISAAFAMMFIAICIDMIILSLIVLIIHFIFPNFGDYLMDNWHVLPIIFGISLIPMYILLTLKIMQKKTKYFQKLQTDNIQFKLTNTFNKIFLNIFYLPYTYIFYTLNTNIKSKYSAPIMFGYMVLVFLLVAPKIDNEVAHPFILADSYFRFNSTEQVFNKYNYENIKPSDAPIITPMIPSDIIEGKFMKLYLPTIHREHKALTSLYGEIQSIDSLSRVENRLRSRKINLDRQADFNTIYVNEQPYPFLEYFSHYADEDTAGYLTYIPTDNFKIGRNTLKIEKKYFDENKKPKTIFIPFMFEGFQ